MAYDNYLEERLDEQDFFRASRKHIINLHWVDNIEPWFNGGLRTTLKNGMHVEVSRRQSAKFKDLMSMMEALVCMKQINAHIRFSLHRHKMAIETLPYR